MDPIDNMKTIIKSPCNRSTVLENDVQGDRLVLSFSMTENAKISLKTRERSVQESANQLRAILPLETTQLLEF